MSRYRIEKGPHLLYVGGNGHKTFGVTILDTEWDPVKDRAFSQRWDENDFTVANCWDDFEKADEFGMTVREMKELRAELARLAEAQ